MKLEEKIRNREIAYFFRRKPEIAFELAVLYFILAKRKTLPRNIIKVCERVSYWLKRASVVVPEYVRQLPSSSQLKEIEKILVLNKAAVGACAVNS